MFLVSVLPGVVERGLIIRIVERYVASLRVVDEMCLCDLAYLILQRRDQNRTGGHSVVDAEFRNSNNAVQSLLRSLFKNFKFYLIVHINTIGSRYKQRERHVHRLSVAFQSREAQSHGRFRFVRFDGVHVELNRCCQNVVGVQSGRVLDVKILARC